MREIVHRIAGYVPGTGLLWERHEIPAPLVEYAKRVAGVDPSDPAALASYPLAPDQVVRIDQVTGWRLQAGGCEYFLEAFISEERLAELRSRCG